MARELSLRLDIRRPTQCLFKSACLLTATLAMSVNAAQIDIAGPAGSGMFGTTVTVLPNGNIVVTDPDGGPVSNAGAVYLYGPTGVLISTLTGSSLDNRVGSGSVTVLSNGNYVVTSPFWDNGASANVGAVTWANGSTGISGVVSAANSLIGTTTNDRVGDGGVTALSNGNYVVRSANWDNGATVDAGAATWANGSTGRSGAVSPANSLIGSTSNNSVGNGGVTALSNGNYVVGSPFWDNGATTNVGAMTWANGSTGLAGAVVSAANSLIGTTTSDFFGDDVIELRNGNYVVESPSWDNGAAMDAGAVTWANGSTGRSGVVSAALSLVGTATDDAVGSVIVLNNGNYVVRSHLWNNGFSADVGAVTWANGSTGLSGTISSANSLIGPSSQDQVGSGGITALGNGNYVVASPLRNNGNTADVGAVTWANGITGLSGTVSTANSLIGPTSGNNVGSGGVTELANGNYVVRSPGWDFGADANVGAVTWAIGTMGTTGEVLPANSLIGTTTGDQVGSSGVTALSNGNYVVRSPLWDNGFATNVGAVTWVNGSTAFSSVVSTVNSLIGTTAGDLDFVGQTAGVSALSNGNYVIRSPNWDGAAANVGAVTWANGTTVLTGSISAANSLIGTTITDQVGITGVTVLGNGNYVVVSSVWNNGGVVDAGAVTWANGSAGRSGVVSAANSLIGATNGDVVGNTDVTALSDNNYVVRSLVWDNGATVNAGAVSLARGAVGVIGPILPTNSVRGTVANGGGATLPFNYDVSRQQLVVGRPASNIVSLFTLPSELIFANGFE